MSPAATRALIRVEETVSPSTSTRGTTRVSNSACAASIAGIALGLGAEAEVLADRDLLGAEPLDQHPLDEFLGAALGELAVEGDHDQLAHAEPLDHVALDAEGHDQLRQRRRVQDLERVRVEGETVSAPSITAWWPRWTPSKVPIATWRGRGSASGSEVTSMLIGPSMRMRLRGPPGTRLGDPLERSGSSSPASSILKGPIAVRRSSRAVGVVEGLDQGADVGPGRALDLVFGAARRRSPSSSAR